MTISHAETTSQEGKLSLQNFGKMPSPKELFHLTLRKSKSSILSINIFFIIIRLFAGFRVP